MNLLICYFSATGNTGQVAQAIGERLAQLGAQVHFKDVTALEDRQGATPPQDYDAVLFGSPIHSMRAPRLFRDWLATLDGQGKRCATFFTFGGFQIAPAPFDTCRRLRERGFVVVASAVFPGAHTYNLAGWRAMRGRPDRQDLELAAEYAEKLYPRLSGRDQAVLGELDPGPYSEAQLDEFESFRFKAGIEMPSRAGAECSLCLQCEERCPTGAMDAQSGEADPARCILCLQCVKDCPDQALVAADMSGLFAMKMDKDQETAETLGRKRGQLYF